MFPPLLLALAGCGAELEGEAAEYGAIAESLDSPHDFQAIDPCPTPSSYRHSGSVRFSLGLKPFTPACVRLASGGTVVFQGSLSEHPIEPRPLGSTPSPVIATYAGGGVEFEFPDHGIYPYRCARHPEEMGVIWSTYQ